jgi:hypothetical protein
VDEQRIAKARALTEIARRTSHRGLAFEDARFPLPARRRRPRGSVSSPSCFSAIRAGFTGPAAAAAQPRSCRASAGVRAGLRRRARGRERGAPSGATHGGQWDLLLHGQPGEQRERQANNDHSPAAPVVAHQHPARVTSRSDSVRAPMIQDQIQVPGGGICRGSVAHLRRRLPPLGSDSSRSRHPTAVARRGPRHWREYLGGPTVARSRLRACDM